MADPKKPGWKTSEFWLTLITNLLSTAYLIGLIGDTGAAGKIAAFAVMALANLGYTVQRGKLKASNTTTPPSA